MLHAQINKFIPNAAYVAKKQDLGNNRYLIDTYWWIIKCRKSNKLYFGMLDLFIMMIGIRHCFILVFFIPFIFYFLWTVMKLTEQYFTSESIYNTLTFTDTHVLSVNKMVFILLGGKTKERVVNLTCTAFTGHSLVKVRASLIISIFDIWFVVVQKLWQKNGVSSGGSCLK